MPASYYVWEPPHHSVTILLNLQLLDSMKAWMRHRELHGKEVGGILLGSSEINASGQTVVIVEDCASVDPVRDRRSAFRARERNSRLLGNAVSEWYARNDSGLVPVGLVRSHSAGALQLDAADFALFEKYFPGTGAAFLLVGSDGAAGFFFREPGGDLNPEPYLAFPFDREKLESERRHTILFPEQRGIVRQHTGLPGISVRVVRPRVSQIWLAGIAIFLLMIVAAAWAGWRAGRPAPAPSQLTTAFGLDVDYLGRALRLKWNPHSAAIQKAKQATLWIIDGAEQKRISLDDVQLAHGSAMYVPVSNQVEFRLGVLFGGKRIADSILSVVPVQAQLPAVAVAAPSAAPTPAATPTPSTAPSSVTERTSPAPVQKAVVTPPPQPRISEPAPASAAKPRAEAPAEPPNAPAAVRAAAPAPKSEPAPLFERQPIPSVSVSYAADPVPEPARRKGIDKIPIVRLFHHHPKNDDEPAAETVPAKPVRQIRPHVPTTVARALPGNWQVELRARIDPQGRITQLEPLSEGMDERLIRLAMSTLNQWEFQPAEVNGHGIASSVSVTFRFHIPAQDGSQVVASRE